MPDDLLLRNARVYPEGDAGLIRDGRFVFVGREAEISVPAGARVIDAGGRFVVPGFVDGHAHLLRTGFAMQAVDLKQTASVEDAVRRVAVRVGETPAGGWIRGAGWDQNGWPGARFPDRRLLDAVAPEHPVVLDHTSGHCVWVNTVALRLAGVTAATPAPEGGAVDIGDDGEPSGILRDNASRLVRAVVPPPTQTDRIEAVRQAIAHAHSSGVTGVHAMDAGRGEFQAMHVLNDSGRLRLRIRAFVSASKLDEWIERAVTTGDGDEMLRIGGVKFFADGALGSLTAWTSEPYASSGDCGFPLQPPDDLERDVRRCLEHGLAPAVHAIGDRANHIVLDIYERARSLAPNLPRRIEHAQLLMPSDIARFAELGVAASVQPIHATQDMAKVDREWGERGAYAYTFASLLASGANLAFGSDSPVETMDPLAGVHAAVTRQRADGRLAGGWYAGERLSRTAAIDAYTLGCARAVGDAGASGRIAPGHHADFVVLSHDLRELDDPMRILDARVEMTAVGGEIVYRREATS